MNLRNDKLQPSFAVRHSYLRREDLGNVKLELVLFAAQFLRKKFAHLLALFSTESTFAIHKKFSSQCRPRDLERLTTKLLKSETWERHILLNRKAEEKEHRDGAGFGEAL